MRARTLLPPLLCAIASLVAISARAEWITDGEPVTLNPDVQRSVVIAPDSAGGAFVGWINLFERRGYVQRLDALGNPLFTAGGTQVTPSPSGVLQGLLGLVPDGTGGVFVAFRVLSFTTINVQHLTATGSVASGWFNDGNQVYPGGTGSSGDPKMVPDGSGGVIVAWDAGPNFPGNTVFAQRLTGGGAVAPGWPTDGVTLSSALGTKYCDAVVSDSAGGAIVVWEDSRDGKLDLYAQRVMADGTIAPGWTFNGVPVSLARDDQRNAVSIPDGAGGAIVAWEDFRSSVLLDIYAQHVTAGGTITSGWLPNGNAVSTAFGDQLNAVIASDGAGGAIIAWQDDRDGPYDIYAQHVTDTGSIATGWMLDGSPLCRAPYHQSSPSIAADGAGGALVAWQDKRSAATYDIFIQRVGGDGTIPTGWPTDGLPICTIFNDQLAPVAAPDRAFGAIVAWQEYRNGNADVYAARVTGAGVVPALLSLVRADAQANRVRLEWFAADGAGLLALLERCEEGGEWRELALLTTDGAGHMVYEDLSVVPGRRYGYRLSVGRRGATQIFGEAWVETPGRFGLRLRGLTPNPSSDDPVVAFDLPDDRPTSLEMIDLAGRRVASRGPESFGPGGHLVRLDRAGALAPGIYLICLTHDGQTLTARACVIR